jgi:hypothetical protein
VEIGPTFSQEQNARCTGWGGEVRGLAGRSLGRAFVNVEAAYLAQTPNCVHARFDVAAGWRLDPQWQAIGQVFTDRSYLQGHAAKAQLSLVRQGRAGRALQVGVRWRLDHAGQENPALLIALWSSPRAAH